MLFFPCCVLSGPGASIVSAQTTQLSFIRPRYPELSCPSGEGHNGSAFVPLSFRGTGRAPRSQSELNRTIVAEATWLPLRVPGSARCRVGP
jgi:hypothetical protein